MNYFPSAEAMAADLDLELLLRAEVDRRMLTRKERLSQFATDATVAGHLYGRVREQQAREKRSQDLRGKILWMTAPFATVEHLSWAVGLADQITRQRGRVYLAASSIETLLPARTGVRGEGLPDAVQNRLRSWLNVPSYSVGTDVEGVRMVVPVTAHDVVGPPPSDSDWTVLLLDPLPEDYDGPYPKPSSVDGVVLVTAFRDHSVTELHDSVAGLRRAGLPLLGVVGMGPEREAEGEGGARPKRRSASIWRTEETPPPPKESAPAKESGPPKVIALPGAVARDTGGRASEPPEGDRTADSEETTWARLGRSGQGAGSSKPGDRAGKAPGTAASRPHGAPRDASGSRSASAPPVGQSPRPASGGARPPVDAPRSGNLSTGRGPDSAKPGGDSTLREATPPRRAPEDQASDRSSAGGRKRKSKKSSRSRPESRVTPKPTSDLSQRKAPTAGGSSGFEHKESGTVWADLPNPAGSAAPPPASRPREAVGPPPGAARPRDAAIPPAPSRPREAAIPPAPSKPRETAVPPEPSKPRETAVPPAASKPRETAVPPAASKSRDAATPPPAASKPRDAATPPPAASKSRDAATPPPAASGRTSSRDAAPTPIRPSESPATDPAPIANVTPLRVTPGARPGAARSLTSEERSVALLTGWQRERQRHAARGSRAAIWIGSTVVLLGLAGAFLLMRPSLIDSGRLPGWLAGSPETVAQQTASPNAKKSGAGTKAPPPVATESSEPSSDWDSSQRDDLLAELRERSQTAVPEGLEATQAAPVGAVGAESPPAPAATADASPLHASISDPAMQFGRTAEVNEDSRSDPALLTVDPRGAESGSPDPTGMGETSPEDRSVPPSELTESTAAPGSELVGSAQFPAAPGSVQFPAAPGSTPPGSLPPRAPDVLTQDRPDAASPSGAAEASIRIDPADPTGSIDPDGVSDRPDRGGSDRGAGAMEASGGSNDPAAGVGSNDPASGGSNDPAAGVGSNDPDADTGQGSGDGETVAAEPIGEPPAITPDAAFVVHLGSFRLRREADAEVARLMGLGYDARALHVNVPGKGPWYRVVMGAFATFAEARENALVLGRTTGRDRPNVVGAGGYGAPVPILEESESPGKATP